MNNYKKHIPTAIRAIIAFLFLLSAVAKLYPSPTFAIPTFEFNQLYPMGFSEKMAAFFSRTLIGIEFALGILILQKNWLKTIIIPATILLLAVFTTHLTYVSFLSGGNTGNCGCFGSLLPMTPIQAIIKNVIAIGLLVYLFKILPKRNEKSDNFWVLSTITLGFILMLFMLAPMKATSNFSVTPPQEIENQTITDSVVVPIIDNNIQIKKIDTTTTKATKIPVAVKFKSGYENYFADIDEDKKILCFFVPGCDHCRATAKELTEMQKADTNFPKIRIIFMDEETNLIPEFFQETGAEYPHQVVDIIGFWKLLGTGKQVPGVKYIKEGKIIKYYFGLEKEKFNAENLKSLINK